MNVKCKLCKSQDTILFMSSFDYRLDSSKKKFDLYQCKNCWFVFLNKIEKNAYKYEGSFFTKLDILSKVNHFFWERKINKVLNDLKIEGPINILDYGCGTGGFIKSLKKNKHINAYGYDPYLPNDDRFLKNNLKDFNIKFKIILMMHVLEHLDDIDHEINNIYNLLDKNGIIIFEVPTLECIEFKFFKKYFFHLDLPRHLNFFNKSNIDLVFKKKFNFYEISNGYTFLLAPFSPIKSSIKISKKELIKKILSYIFFIPFLIMNIFKFKNSYFSGIVIKNDN